MSDLSKIDKDALLIQAWDYCEDNEKSTEFMLQYMQDVAGVDLDYVLDFLVEYSNIEDDE